MGDQRHNALDHGKGAAVPDRNLTHLDAVRCTAPAEALSQNDFQ